MSLLHTLVRKAARAQPLMALKAKIGGKLRETYYNAEVLHRIEDKTAPLNVIVSADEPARINLLIPEIDFRTFYGGYIAKFNLAQFLTDYGHKVRFIIVDPCTIDAEAWRLGVAEYNGIESIFDNVEFAYCYDRSTEVMCSPNDKVIATTWWTAYIAHEFCQVLSKPKFLYLIQEYEPLTFPMGSYYAIAQQSYSFPHNAVFSSPQLYDYFKLHGLGLFGHDWGCSSEAMPFENAIMAYQPDELNIRTKQKYKLLFYARPEAHAARNMFEVAYLALAKAIETGAFDRDQWEFHGIGSSHGDIPLPKGHTLKMLGKFGLKEYKQKLLDYDIGLSLMYTPHPSLLPLEMAAAGMWVVSNSCENKTQEELSAISTNILAPVATINDVAASIIQAASDVDKLELRRKGAEVHWANSWRDAFNHEKMQALISWL